MIYSSNFSATLCGAFIAVLLSACGGGSDTSSEQTTGTASSRPIINKEVKEEDIISAADGSAFAKAQLVLILDEDAAADDPQKICLTYSCTVVGTIPEARTYQLEFQSNTSFEMLESIATRIGSENGVSFVTKNYIAKTSNSAPESNPGYMEQRWAHDQIELQSALKYLEEYNKTSMLHPVTLGIIDAGFEQQPGKITFTRLLGPAGEDDSMAAFPVISRDWPEGDYGKRAAAASRFNHGQHVAGIIAAQKNSNTPSDIHGVADGIPLRLLGARTDLSVMSSLSNFARLVRLGARVINMSLGATEQASAVGPSSFRVDPNIQNDGRSWSPVGMWAARLPGCPHVHGAGVEAGE